jgi:hypothetical protein
LRHHPNDVTLGEGRLQRHPSTASIYLVLHADNHRRVQFPVLQGPEPDYLASGHLVVCSHRGDTVEIGLASRPARVMKIDAERDCLALAAGPASPEGQRYLKLLDPFLDQEVFLIWSPQGR